MEMGTGYTKEMHKKLSSIFRGKNPLCWLYKVYMKAVKGRQVDFFYSLGDIAPLNVFNCEITLGGFDFRKVTLYRLN